MTDPRRQLRQRLESLRAAGVEFLPKSTGLPTNCRVGGGFAQPTVAPPTIADSVDSRSVGGGFAQPTVASPAASVGSAKPPPTRQEAPPNSPTASDGFELRRAKLQLLAQQVAQCKRCPELTRRTQSVFGVGPLDPELCMLGEAPGADEDQQGEPFVGAAGQLLNKIIAAMGMKREEIYICNILRCRPPGNRTPKSDEAANCREWLDETLRIVRPRFICCLGSVAAKNLLGVDLTIGRMRKKFYEYDGIPVLCTYHPSYLLRQETAAAMSKVKMEVWDDMKILLAKMGRSLPVASPRS